MIGALTRRGKAGERGSTLVLLGVCLTGLMALSGLAIDGGRMFADRRQVQNSADAAALAGAQVMRNEMADQSNTWTTDQIWTAVQKTATSDGVNSGSVTCYLIDSSYNPIAYPNDATTVKPCSAYVSTDPLPDKVFGVFVSTTDTQSTAFMSVVGLSHFTTSANAAAAVEATTLSTVIGSADIEVCAVSGSDPKSGNKNQGQTTTSGANISILIPNASGLGEMINPAAIGKTYWIKGNKVDKECDSNGNFKGLVCKPNTTCPPESVPGYWPSDPGNHSGPFRNSLAANCDGTTVGCTFALPLCYAADQGPQPATGDLYCVLWGSFQVTAATANSDAAVFTGQAFTEPGGQGGGPPVNGEPATVRLVE